MATLSIFGTSSDAGKSTLTWILGALLRREGLSVAPFKAQNVSNNAAVADDGSEIAYAQYFQARVLQTPTSWHNNPVLLKSGTHNAASLIVRGKAAGNTETGAYYRDIDTLKPAVDEALRYLNERYDCVLAEGAGSPVELNLMSIDLSNIYVADTTDARIVLVADIEKGGVFASVYGVMHLLPEKLRRNLVGVIVNKFRGDMRFFDEGVRIIEERFGLPVLGVMPHMPLNIGFEDSQSLRNYAQDCRRAKRRVGIVAYPTMSNYTDFEPLLNDETVCAEFIDYNRSLEGFDTIILPGSKRVIADLRWLKSNGLFENIRNTLKRNKTKLTAVCGGYEMLFREIFDPYGIEGEAGEREKGFGFIDDTVTLQRQKILKRDGARYQIRHGTASHTPDTYESEHIYGTFWHGSFEDASYQKRMARITEETLQAASRHLRTEIILHHILG
jgi:adenosylcobyric acid synthase